MHLFQFCREEEEKGFPGSAVGSIKRWRQLDGRGRERRSGHHHVWGTSFYFAINLSAPEFYN